MKVKWLTYTVLVGLIPFFSRLLIFFLTASRNIDLLFNPSDFVAFGLILHISNINELEHSNLEKKSWKTIQNGLSIVFIAAYSVLFVIAVIEDTISPGVFNQTAVRVSPMILSIPSFALSYSIFDRLAKLESASE